MALTYRSPVEDVLNRFTSEEQSKVSNPAVLRLANLEKKQQPFFSFAMSDVGKQKLSEAGIYLSPYSFEPHSHPICKTLENYMLFEVSASLIDNSFFFVGIKNSKISFLKSRDKNLSCVNAINRYVTSLDKVRYPNNLVVVNSTQNSALTRKGELALDSKTLKDLIPSVISSKARKLFIHDELHYWDPSQVCNFLMATNPDHILATVIIPPELLIDSNVSLNQWCYKLSIKDGGKRFLFSPDGVDSEGYIQKVTCRYLLKARRFVCPDGSIYNVDVVCSKFAHHLISITKGNLLNQESRFFNNFEAVHCSGLSLFSRKIGDHLPIDYAIISKMYRYLRTLKKPDKESGMAKLSQIVPNPTSFQIKFFEEFNQLFINHASKEVLTDAGVFSAIKCFFSSMLPRRMGRLIKRYRTASLDQFIFDLAPLSIGVETVDIGEDYKEELYGLLDNSTSMSCDDVIKLFDNFDNGGKSFEMGLKRPDLYFSNIQEPQAFMLSFNERLITFLVKLYVAPMSPSEFKVIGQELCVSLVIRALNKREAVSKFVPHHSVLNRIITDAYIQVKGEVKKSFQIKCVFKVSLGQVRFWFFNLNKRFNMKFIKPNLDEDLETTRGRNKLQSFISRNSSEIKELAKSLKRGWRNVGELRPDVVEVIQVADSVDTLNKSTEEVEQSDIQILPEPPTLAICAPPEVIQGEVPEKGGESQLRMDNLFKNVVLEELEFHPISMGPNLLFLEGLDHIQLKGRVALFFSRCGCHTYGHNNIKYKTIPWFVELDNMLKEDPNYYNTCLVQIYDAGAKIGHHSDNEKCYVDTPVRTFNYNGDAEFEIKKKGRLNMGEKFNFKLRDGESFTMGPYFQRKYTHSVQALTNGRISFTFRRQDLSISGAKISHNCGNTDFEEELFGVRIFRNSKFKLHNFVDFEVSGDGNCFWHAMGALLGLDHGLIKKNSFAIARKRFKELSRQALDQEGDNVWAEREAIAIFCSSNSIELIVLYEDGTCYNFRPTNEDAPTLFCSLVGNHFKPALPKNGCVIRAVSKLLNREESKVLSVLGRSENRHILESLSEGNGIGIEEVEEVMTIFGIKATVITDRGTYIVNDSGRLPGTFELKDSHLLLVESSRVSSHSIAQNRVTHIQGFGATEKLNQSASLVKYRPNFDRAKMLSDSLLEGNTGVLSDALMNNQTDWLEDTDSLTTTERDLGLILGTFGSGKSTIFKKFIKENPSRMVVFVSPRKMLAEMMRDDVLDKKRRSYNRFVQIKTFEVFLKSIKQFKNHVIIFDEIQLFPPGYLDLVLLCISTGVKIYITGDPCQSEYDSQSDRLNFAGVKSDIENILVDCTYNFNICSRRFISSCFIGRLPCQIERSSIVINDDGFDVLNSLEEAARVDESEFDVILVSSFAEKNVIKSYFGQTRCHTFGESTGLTFRKGMVLISVESISSSERRWLTALSRFREGMIFINCLSPTIEDVAVEFSGRVLERFLCSRANLNDLKEFLPGNPIFKVGFSSPVGKDEFVKEDKLRGDPWLKTQIFLGQVQDMETSILSEGAFLQPEMKTHLPIVGLESIRANWVDRILDREKRELRIGSEVSNQFCDDHSKNNGEKITNAAQRFESIYPRHRGSDSVTFLMAVKKRLKFSNPIRESRKLRAAKSYGKFLLDTFLKRVKLNNRQDLPLFLEAEQDFFDKKVSKSAATIENHSGRSCRDWLADVALIFMKSQYCSKWDNRFRDAKAGQTLACFQHSVLCRFAPYMRYIEKKVIEALPPNFYIHSGKGLDELNEWVKLNGFTGECTESDYEAFDASQDQYTLAFELALMKYLQIPDGVIADYEYIKTHLGSKLGGFAIMRFTGEASTFLFNTLANMVFTFLRYDVCGGEAICFAGDDMCSNTRLRVKRTNEDFLSKIKLKAKVSVTTQPTFCGWHLSRFGIFKKPQLVLERLAVARETNNLINCIDSYAIEVSYGYRLGDLLNEVMDPEELTNHYSTVRFLIKHQNLLKSDVRMLFQPN